MQEKARKIRRDKEKGLCSPNAECPFRHEKHPQLHKLFSAGWRKSRSLWFYKEVDGSWDPISSSASLLSGGVCFLFYSFFSRRCLMIGK